MFNFFKKAICMAGVSSTLQVLGMHKNAARDLVDNQPDFFALITDILKHLDNQHRNIIATIILLHILIDNEKEPHYLLYEYKKEAYDIFKYQLKTSPKWKEIAIGINTAMHIILGEKMPSEQEIIEEFDPSKIKFSSY